MSRKDNVLGQAVILVYVSLNLFSYVKPLFVELYFMSEECH